jgi:hypothetical protein
MSLLLQHFDEWKVERPDVAGHRGYKQHPPQTTISYAFPIFCSNP